MVEEMKTSEQVMQKINELLDDQSGDQQFAKLLESASPAVSVGEKTLPEAAPQDIQVKTASVEEVESVVRPVEVAVKNNEAAKKRIEKKEKEQPEKKTEDVKEGKKEEMSGKKAEAEKIPDSLEDARRRYARTEFRHQEKMRELEKGSGFNLLKMGKKYPENPDIMDARMVYEKELKAKMDKQISELEAKYGSGELDDKKLQTELKELYTYYNVKAAHDLYNARTDEIIAYKKETSPDKSALRQGWDKVSLGMTNVANWYNKEVPFWVKGGLAVTSFVVGAGALTTTKRVWGALLMATTGGMQLDAAAQFMDKWQSGKKGTKNIKEATTKEGKVDFEKFKGILDGEIGSMDKKLDKYVLRSKVNKAVAVGMALVFGTMAFSSWAHALPNSGAEHASVNPTEAKLPPIPKSGVFADADGGMKAPVGTPNIDDAKGWSENSFMQAQHHKIGVGKEWSTNALEHAKEHGHMPTNEMTESLRIEKGSSIEGTLIKYYKNHGLNFKDNGHAAHRAYRDYMHDYIENHKDELVKSGKLAEYQKMYEDGMVNVKPGTEIVIDPHTGNIVSIDGKLSHLHVAQHGAGGVSHVPNTELSGADASNRIPDGSEKNIPTPDANLIEELKNKVDALENHDNAIRGEAAERIIANEDRIKVLDKDYSETIGEALNEHNDSVWTKLVEKSGVIDRERINLTKSLESAFGSDKSAADSLRSIRKDIVGSNSAKWRIIENMKVSDVVKDEDFNKLPKVGKNIISAFSQDKDMTFRPNETMKDWTRRVVVSTQRLMGAPR